MSDSDREDLEESFSHLSYVTESPPPELSVFDDSIAGREDDVENTVLQGWEESDEDGGVDEDEEVASR